MSRTLSVLILENFVINEGPKWDKFKKGAKKVGKGAVIAAALGSATLAGIGGNKISDANRNYQLDMDKSQIQHQAAASDIFRNRIIDINNIDSDNETAPETKNSLKSQIEKNSDRELHNSRIAKTNKQVEATYRRDNQHAKGTQTLAGAGAAGIGAVALAVGSKDKKKKQASKSLKERLNLVKPGVFLNEESADVTALRNKINQGLILLPGLKGSAVDKMEESIRG